MMSWGLTQRVKEGWKSASGSFWIGWPIWLPGSSKTAKSSIAPVVQSSRLVWQSSVHCGLTKIMDMCQAC